MFKDAISPTPSQPLPIAVVGEAILKEQAIEVHDFDTALSQLAEQMAASMEAAKGVGIAAPQVHSPLALFIMASRPNERYPDAPQMDPVVVVNPEILSASADLVCGEEGCLSVPGQRFTIWRHQQIVVRYQNLAGQWQRSELTGFIARIFQHEFDHLQGITLLERSQMPEQKHMAREGKPQA
ncbi:peptide deformylase [Shewanella bicestrii]